MHEQSTITPLDAERFWARVDRSGPIQPHTPELGPCWPFISKQSNDGYHRLNLGGKMKLAHRVAYELANGGIDDALLVLHGCDYRPCCNPGHLRQGTHQDNGADAAARKRNPSGKNHWLARHPELHPLKLHPEYRATGDRSASRKHPERKPRGNAHWTRRNPDAVRRGAAVGTAKLTTENVLAIHRRKALGERAVDLAREYGVTASLIHRIVGGKAWSHLR